MTSTISTAARLGIVAALALAGLALPAAASAAQLDDLQGQTIDPDQAQGTGRVVIESGHVDMGPTLATGEWRIQLHDDTSSPRYWRNPEDVVLRVADAGVLEIPDDEGYTFLGIEPGTPVHVIPQTQNPDVVWLGWNTQEPGVLEQLASGATLSMDRIEGPGDIDVFLQSGNFGAPQPLWDSTQPLPQDAFIERNIHTHVNWVFSEPGIYLVEMTFAADLASGERVSSTDVLRFAVGDETDAEAAFNAQFSSGPDGGADAGADDAAGGSAGDDAQDAAAPADDPTGLVIGIVAGVVVAVVLISVVVVLTASRRARARALAQRDPRATSADRDGGVSS